MKLLGLAMAGFGTLVQLGLDKSVRQGNVNDRKIRSATLASNALLIGGLGLTAYGFIKK